uniref:VWFD domain-containing protein n=1 Tax=Biomphalaria glabrata TaxID=6526 RepID=A0A2C9M5I6_BIOGL
MAAILFCLSLAWILSCLEAKTITSNGGVGPLCGAHTCATNAICSSRQGETSCVCDRDYRGIGSFVCVPENDNYCAIFNDPSVKSFDGSHVQVPGEQMTFAAHIGTKLCYRNDKGAIVTAAGSCDVRVYVWYCRRRGKFFTCGMLVKVMVFNNSTVKHHTTRIYGEASQGRYIFKEEGQRCEFGNGLFADPIETEVAGIGRIKSAYNYSNNFAFLDVGVCGIKVGLRPVDSVWDPLITPAGIVVTTSQECEPDYLSVEQTICSPPTGKGPSLEQQAAELSQEVGDTVTKEDLACLKVICGDVNQNFPGAQTNLNNLHETCNSCDKRTLVQAIKQCCFILHNPSFVNCYDKQTDVAYSIIKKQKTVLKKTSKLTSLLDECLFGLCSENSDMCRLVQNSIEDSGCADKIRPNQYTILNSTCEYY